MEINTIFKIAKEALDNSELLKSKQIQKAVKIFNTVTNNVACNFNFKNYGTAVGLSIAIASTTKPTFKILVDNVLLKQTSGNFYEHNILLSPQSHSFSFVSLSDNVLACKIELSSTGVSIDETQ